LIELSSLKPLDEATVTIIHPVLKDIGVTFNVIGSDSKEYRQMTNDLMLKRMSQEEKPSREELEDDELSIIVTSVKSFSGVMIDGKELKSNKENIKKILSECGWIKDQISSFIINKSNFFLKD